MLKKIGLLAGALVILFIFFSLFRQTYDALSASGRLDSAASSLSKLQQENSQLQEALRGASGYGLVEKEARNDLNLAKSNETVVIIPPQMIDQVLAAEKTPPEIKIPNWQGWLKLVFH